MLVGISINELHLHGQPTIGEASQIGQLSQIDGQLQSRPGLVLLIPDLAWVRYFEDRFIREKGHATVFRNKGDLVFKVLVIAAAEIAQSAIPEVTLTKVTKASEIDGIGILGLHDFY